MTAYVLCIREKAIRDHEAMSTYSRMNREAPPAANLTPLIVYGKSEALEGQAPDGVVLLQFPTLEDAKTWYNSPSYQAAIPHRQKGADYRIMIIQGL